MTQFENWLREQFPEGYLDLTLSKYDLLRALELAYNANQTVEAEAPTKKIEANDRIATALFQALQYHFRTNPDNQASIIVETENDAIVTVLFLDPNLSAKERLNIKDYYVASIPRTALDKTFEKSLPISENAV